jgi:hypothetical protein
MSAAGASETATVAALMSVCKSVTTTLQDFGAVVSELQSMQMALERSREACLIAGPISP